MQNLLKSIGVLLILGGVSCLLIGVLRLLIPAMDDKLVPEGFKKIVSVQSGALILLSGLFLIYL